MRILVRVASLLLSVGLRVLALLTLCCTLLFLPLLLTDSYRQSSHPLLTGAAFAFLSQLSSIGKGLQKVGVQNLPELCLRRAVLVQYIACPTWRNGLFLDLAGAVFGLAALTIVPISVAQPIFCNGLVLLALYSHFHLKEQLGQREWLSISLCFAGTLLLAVTLVPRDWNQTSIEWIQVKLGLVLLLAAPLLATLEIWARRAKRGNADRSVIELLAGMQAGLCIGVGNASLATGLQSTSKSWIDHLGSGKGVWMHLACAGAFVVIGVVTNAMHPIFANRGYQLGRVVLISTYMSLVSMATGVFMGVVVLDEAWPTRPRMSLLRHIAFGLIFSGVLTLNWQNIRLFTAAAASRSSQGSASHKRNKSDGCSASLKKRSGGEIEHVACCERGERTDRAERGRGVPATERHSTGSASVRGIPSLK